MKFLFFLVIFLTFFSCNSEQNENNVCQDNPCKDNTIPHKTECKTEGNTFICICEKGYIENSNGVCIKNEDDPDEVCKPDTCPEENFKCRNYNGKPICVCKEGFELKDGKCVSNNPCKDNPCNEPHKSICSSIDYKTHICYCDKGYAPDGNGNCILASYGNYYDGISDDLKDDALIDALYNLIKDHRSISYNRAEDELYDLDGAVCSYTGLTGLRLNVEHIWPQSYFGGVSPMVSDLHHLRLVSSYVNSKRGNIHFGNVVRTDCNPDCYDNCSYGNDCAENNNCCYYCDWDGLIRDENIQTQAKKGKPDMSCSSYSIFEVMDEFKGDVARSLFYFAVRYKNDSINQSQAYMTGPGNKNHIPPYEEIVLRRWHKEDPVSQKEIERNNKIYNNIQHNRNPFIDRPDLVDRISDF